MKKILGIVVLGLLWCNIFPLTNNAFSEVSVSDYSKYKKIYPNISAYPGNYKKHEPTWYSLKEHLSLEPKFLILVNQKIDAKKKGKKTRIEKKYIYNSKHNLFDFNKRKCRGNIEDPRKITNPLCRELAKVEIDDSNITLKQFVTDVFKHCTLADNYFRDTSGKKLKLKNIYPYACMISHINLTEYHSFSQAQYLSKGLDAFDKELVAKKKKEEERKKAELERKRKEEERKKAELERKRKEEERKKAFELAENKFGNDCINVDKFSKGTKEYNNCIQQYAKAEIERNKLKVIFIKNKIVNSELLGEVKNDTKDNHLIIDEFKQEKFNEFEKFKYANLLFVIQKDFETSSIIVNEKSVQSQYKSGVRHDPNPRYMQIQGQIRSNDQAITINSNRYYQLQNSRRQCGAQFILDEHGNYQNNPDYVNCNLQQWGIGNQMNGLNNAITDLRNANQKLINQLSNTSHVIETPLYQPYSFTEYDIEVIKKAKYEIYQIKEDKFYKNSIMLEEKEKFVSANNIRNDDKNYHSLNNKYKNQNEIVSWQKKKMKALKISEFLNNFNKQINDNESINKAELLASLNVKSETTVKSKYKKKKKKYIKKTKKKKIKKEKKLSEDLRFDSVVVVKTEKGLGSGFFIETNKILTNYHVVENSSVISIKDKKGKSSSAVLLKKDLERDLALLITNMNGQPVQFYNEPLFTGMEVQALGHPKGLRFSMTAGIISSVRKMSSTYSVTNDENILFIQTDAAINPGNSGGPLFYNDFVVGVNTQGLAKDQTEGLNFAVHVEEIQKFLNN